MYNNNSNNNTILISYILHYIILHYIPPGPGGPWRRHVGPDLVGLHAPDALRRGRLFEMDADNDNWC